ncbi:MAG: filamentous hemagglutinin N-terminal domain-containing protein [Geitlerinemataceae cyanobacterium]
MFRSLARRPSALSPLLSCLFGLSGFSFVINSTPLGAQLVPDATLPDVSIARDTPDGQTVTGGTLAGSNLFHSFERFAIPDGTRVEFAADGAIANIFTRVTGDGIATIDGTLATGDASFYLLAPGGAIFGENARLDVGRDFTVTTGAAIDFDDGRSFGLGAIDSAALLSVGVPIGLGQGSVGAGDIVNRSSALDAAGEPVGLQVNTGQGVTLVGRNIEFAGGYATSIDGSFELSATETIAITAAGRIETSGETGGTIAIAASVLQTLDGSKILADSLRTAGGTDLPNEVTANIAIDVDRLEVRNDALISTSTFGPGRGGTIRVNAPTVELTGTASLDEVLPVLFEIGVFDNPDQIGSGLFAMSLGAGDAGTLDVNATDIRLENSGFISAIATGAGNGGTLNVSAANITLRDAEIFADTFGAGAGGVVNLTADSVRLVQGGGIFASNFDSGPGGRVNVTADSIEIDGTTPQGQFTSGIGSNAFSAVETEGGIVTIDARTISLTDGGVIGVATFGPARGGTIIIRASESIAVDGLSGDESQQSSITTQSRGTGEAGDIELSTGRLSVTGGASVFTSALAEGPAGRLTVRASESVEVSGRSPSGEFPSSLRADAEVSGAPSSFIPPSTANVVGAAGDLTVITPELRVSNGATLIASSQGEGEQAGNLSIEADRVRLDTGATIVAETAAATEGNLSISADTVQLRRGAAISSNASGVAQGGNIAIVADTLVGLENSDITANAEDGNGGQVRIDASGVFGLAFRNALTPESDITATSALGFQFSGTVELRSPEVQLDTAIVALPENFAGVDNVRADRCRGRSDANRFTVSGNGGTPVVPGTGLLPLPATAPQAAGLAASSASARTSAGAAPTIAEATGFAQTDRGYALTDARAVAPPAPDCRHLPAQLGG